MTCAHEESSRDQNGLSARLVDPNDSRDSGKEHAETTGLGPGTYHCDCAKAYTIPTTPVARREVLFPVKPRSWKINGA